MLIDLSPELLSIIIVFVIGSVIICIACFVYYSKHSKYRYGRYKKKSNYQPSAEGLRIQQEREANAVKTEFVGSKVPIIPSKYSLAYHNERTNGYHGKLDKYGREIITYFSGEIKYSGPSSQMDMFDKKDIEDFVTTFFSLNPEVDQSVINVKVNELLMTKWDKNKNTFHIDMFHFLENSKYYVFPFRYKEYDPVSQEVYYFCKTRAAILKKLPDTKYAQNDNHVALFDKTNFLYDDLRLLTYILVRNTKKSYDYVNTIIGLDSILNDLKPHQFEQSKDYCFEYIYKTLADSSSVFVNFPNKGIVNEIVARIVGYYGWPRPYELITALAGFQLEMHNAGFRKFKYYSQANLFNLVKETYDDAIYQYHTQWLDKQSLDIYIPSLKVAIEYQGQQHYKSVRYFGGKENRLSNERRDQSKQMLCLNHGINLIEWKFNVEISKDNLDKLLEGYK